MPEPSLLHATNRPSFRTQLPKDVYFYRITTPQFSDREVAFNGGGSINSPGYGRFNAPHQRTTYCADSALVCIAERLYHLYRDAKPALAQRPLDPRFATESLSAYSSLLIFKATEDINELVHLGGDYAQIEADSAFGAGATAEPGPQYDLFAGFNNLLRTKKTMGVRYPSSRYSGGSCYALFHDVTKRIDSDSYQQLTLTLQLVHADQDRNSEPPDPINPLVDKLHSTMGYYQFEKPADLTSATSNGLIVPASLPSADYVDFVSGL